MAEYINRDDVLLKLIKRFCDGCNEKSDDCETKCVIKIYQLLVSDIPAADVVEVVRCKDCVIPHNRFTGCPRAGGRIVPAAFYCADGERSENHD